MRSAEQPSAASRDIVVETSSSMSEDDHVKDERIPPRLTPVADDDTAAPTDDASDSSGADLPRRHGDDSPDPLYDPDADDADAAWVAERRRDGGGDDGTWRLAREGMLWLRRTGPHPSR